MGSSVFKAMRKTVTIADLAVMLLVIAGVFISAHGNTHKDDIYNVYIYKDDVLHGIYNLNVDKYIQIDAHNSVQIKAGKVRMASADCPDKRCVRQGASSSLPIICLPNHVVVEIRSAGKNDIRIIR